MGVKTALVLGVFVVAAALVDGGIYTAGHDFVVNRFTGYYEFVPSDEAYDEGSLPASAAVCRCPSLTSWRPRARVARLQRGR